MTDRFAIFATAVCDRPVASPTARRENPDSTAARIKASRFSVHSRAFSAALATAERSVIGLKLTPESVPVVAGGEPAVDVDEAPESLLGHPELDFPVAVLALVLAHVMSVNKGSALVNKVAA